MAQAATSIARYAPPEAAVPVEFQGTADPLQLAPRLAYLLQCWGSDSPKTVRLALADLQGHVAPVHLRPLYAAIDNFDFRGGELATQNLTGFLGIPAETPPPP